MLKTLSICVMLLLSFDASAQEAARHDLDPVNMQLRWHPQFQFAGYYAAVDKGFYAEEGLDVQIHAGAPDRQPVEEILSGRAQYAEGNSEVLLARLEGRPLVALAVIFQHSPSVLLALKKSGIESARDLVGKKVMLVEKDNDPDFVTMLLNAGVSPKQVNILPSSYNFEDLIDGKVDAFNSYLTNEPFYLKQRNIDYTIINPRNYSVDFYSDILFTTEAEIQAHPKRAEAMLRATLKGWRYAMDHPDEIIDLLIDKYHVNKSREHLKFEADAMRQLILPELIEIGHMNPERWRQMADTFISAGIVGPTYSLNGFIYEAPASKRLPTWVLVAFGAATLLLAVITLLATYFVRINRRLAATEHNLLGSNETLRENLQQIQELQTRLQEQVIRDSLTGLYNRRYLDETLDRELARAKRDGYPICVAMIDLDHFKQVNDTYGHKAGDEVLKTLGELLRENVRDGDIPCRYGGEEFLIVLPNISLEHAKQRADQWREEFSRRKTRHGDFEIGITMSVGLACYPEHGNTADALLENADRGLYRAKSTGRNRVEVAG